MKLNSNYPTLNFDGVDQLNQLFHVVVMKQTYTWDDTGKLILADAQEAICVQDRLVDPDDTMSGVIIESDLSYYKPKCDVLVVGHAYPPKKIVNKKSKGFDASIRVQQPNIAAQTQESHEKYLFTEGDSSSHHKTDQDTAVTLGEVLINKKLHILAPRDAVRSDDSIFGTLSYKISSNAMPEKVSLHQCSSFGGYCVIEEKDHTSELLASFPKEELLNDEDREYLRLNPHHGKLAYMAENTDNPYGSGYVSTLYLQKLRPEKISLPQLHYSEAIVDESVIDRLCKRELTNEESSCLIAGFGVCSKSHRDRAKYIGDITDEFIHSDALLPENFDFSIYNCAYTDQQTDFLSGNEWLKLTNLCSSQTKASIINSQGDTELNLYLPDKMAHITVVSNKPELPSLELPMNLDTLIISPDEHQATLTWRAMVIADFEPIEVSVDILDKNEQEELIKKYT